MKKYIKSYTANELKAQLGDKYPQGGYLYILKHGIGPGTIPRDVTVVKTKDLPNYYTAVWLDRFLSADELREYDIPSETDINKYLGRINYCQKNGDVVPCDDVQACGQVTAAVKTHPKIPTGWNRVSEGDDENGNWTTISKELPNNDGYYWIDLYEDDNGKKYYEIQVGYRTADGSISDVSMLTSKQFYHLGDAVKFAEDKIIRDYDQDIDACGKVNAATDLANDQVKFFYKGEFLGSCNPEYMECDKLYELLKSDTRAATQVLNYMNSLGDPVFPTEEGGYEAETDVSKVDIRELYALFMQELYYSYQDFPEDFYVGGDYILPDFEIFTGAVAEDVEI